MTKGVKLSDFPSVCQIKKCHICNRRTIVVGCYIDSKPSYCKKKYCFDCYNDYFDEDIHSIMETTKRFSCPFKRKICNCNKCKNYFNNKLQEQNQQAINSLNKLTKCLFNLNSKYHLLSNSQKMLLSCKLREKYLNLITKV